MIQKKISSSLSWQSSETKPRTKLVLVSREPLLISINKMFLRLIYLKIELFPVSKYLLTDTDWCQEWNFKTSLFKSGKINTYHWFSMPMFLSVSGHSSELSYNLSQRTDNSIAAKMCLRHYIILIWESPTTEYKNFHRHLGEQGWRSGESAHLPPMWPGFDSRFIII